ncbi:MAG: Gfo/Idh/MocA family oxidoreductase [Oscillospiraceae bacterium]|nr:Gfo/Idh/MocA family oxidoreductase [Oscillospiraceae bacterium]
MSTLRIGVIGVGNIGSAHVSCLLSGRINGAKLTAVCDVKEARLAYFEKSNPELAKFSDYKELAKSGMVDAVIVSVPHRMHAEIASYCLKQGLHVLVEKPEDVSVSKAKEINATADECGKVFAIMFNQRTNPLFIKARTILKSGQLGALKRTSWIVTNWYRTQHYYNSGDWRATWSGEGGGVLLNQAPHNLDLWQWICGKPCEITAFCDEAKYHNIEVEDDVTIFARFEGGATGTFITSTGELPGTNRLEICGDLGKIVIENGKLKWWKLSESERVTCFESNSSFVEGNVTYEEITSDDGGSAHAGIIQNFVNCILNGEELISDGREGINELMISNAAYLSQWTGNAKISLPIDDELFDKLLEEKAKRSEAVKKGIEPPVRTEYSERWQVKF